MNVLRRALQSRFSGCPSLCDLGLFTHRRGIFVARFDSGFFEKILIHPSFDTPLYAAHWDHQGFCAPASEGVWASSTGAHPHPAEGVVPMGEGCAQGEVINLENEDPFSHRWPIFWYLSTAGATAETLVAACQSLGVSWEDVRKIVLAGGPGSFTGLRLGAAFVNGFLMGRKNKVDVYMSAPNLTPALGIARRWWEGLLPWSPGHDPWSGDGNLLRESQGSDGLAIVNKEGFQVPSVFESFVHILSAFLGQKLPDNQFVEPHYGKEPTPVIRLRNKETNS